jgi:hypothetical protein
VKGVSGLEDRDIQRIGDLFAGYGLPPENLKPEWIQLYLEGLNLLGDMGVYNLST